MIIGIGMDMVDIDRIRKSVENPRFVARVYTDGEAAYCAGTTPSEAAFAARFAAKEAFLKALGCGLADGISWQDVEVLRSESGRPSLQVTGRAGEIMKQLGATRCHLTMTHTDAIAAATVILESDPDHV